MAEYVPTIGLEIHAELATRTGMFCDCPNDPEETRPNVNVCPVCLGAPGALPTINKQAVEAVIKVGLALEGKIAEVSKFDRKNYFYPDLPKGYQISQYDQPLVTGGELHGVRITRVHLEEDTGTLVHDPAGGDSLADFNRAGVPLMELVTEPDIHDAETAVRFAKELQIILRYLGVSDANMEKGQMRVEVNISVAKPGAKELGTKVEVKNINSFKVVEGAINYEIKRQSEALEAGRELAQETRGWDEGKRATVSQRSKEEAHDYRYFPEPDLPPFEPGKVFDLEALRRRMPELPRAKRARFEAEFGLERAQAEQLIEDERMAGFYEAAVSELARREEDENEGKAGRAEALRLLFNYLTSDLRGLMAEHGGSFEDLKIDPENFSELVDMIADKEITSRQAKDLLREMYVSGGDPSNIMKDKGVELVADEGALMEAVRAVIAAQPQAAEDYRGGKEASLQFLIGQAMKALKGQGEPMKLAELFKRELKGE